jgi:hypothetical protein
MLTRDEKLALLEAMSKKIKPLLEDVKGEAKLELLELCRESGIDRKAIMVDGQKVGEIGISYTTAKPAIVPGKEKEALEYLAEAGLVDWSPKRGWEKGFAKAGDAVVDTESGAICDFLCWEPSIAKTAAVRGCKPDAVLEAIQPKLAGGDIMGLLEGSDD